MLPVTPFAGHHVEGELSCYPPCRGITQRTRLKRRAPQINLAETV